MKAIIVDDEFLAREELKYFIQNYSKIVKDNGTLVYATCSILPIENEKQIETFLNSTEGKGFKLISQETLYPSETNFDGFFMALLQKT